MHPKKPPNMAPRKCNNCECDISHRYQSAKKCEGCSNWTAWEKAYYNERIRLAREYDPPKTCARCDGPINNRPAQASLCLTCVPLAMRDSWRKKNAKRQNATPAGKLVTAYFDDRSPLEKLLDQVNAINGF